MSNQVLNNFMMKKMQFFQSSQGQQNVYNIDIDTQITYLWILTQKRIEILFVKNGSQLV